MDEFRHRTIKGIAWSLVSQVGRQVLAFVIGITLARLLSPREFGLVAMVLVFTGFANIFTEMGFSAALIQKQDVRQEHLSSVFWLNLMSGFLLMAIFMVGSPLVATFYREPLLIPLTMLVSANFFIGSFNIVQSTLMTKSLNFRTLSVVEIAAVVISGTVAIVMAYSGFGVWSLAVQTVVFSIVTAMLLWKLSPWRPNFKFNWRAVRELLGFSTSLLGTQMLNYWVRNIDNLLIGRFLGSDPLGAYSRAYSVMLLPLTNISRVLSRVMFPAFSIIQEDKRRVRNMYLRMTRTIALFTFPLMLGLFVTVDPFVITVFGQQWAEMIPILQVLCLLGVTQSIGTLNGNLYLSQGRADLQFKVGLFLKANAILGIVIGLHWGVVGVAIGYTISSFINSYPSFFFAGRLLDLTFSELLRNLSSTFACATAMAISVYALGLLLPAHWPHWPCLVVEVLFGVLVYIFLIHFFKVQAYIETIELLKEQWKNRFNRKKLTPIV